MGCTNACSIPNQCSCYTLACMSSEANVLVTRQALQPYLAI